MKHNVFLLNYKSNNLHRPPITSGDDDALFWSGVLTMVLKQLRTFPEIGPLQFVPRRERHEGDERCTLDTLMGFSHANKTPGYHYSDVIMVSQITCVSIVCLTMSSGANQRKHQNTASLAFVRGIHRWPVDSPHKGPVTLKMFPEHCHKSYN